MIQSVNPIQTRATTTLSLVALAVAALLLGSSHAGAVLIATGDGTGNTTTPANVPAVDNVGVLNGLSGVYVRNGWVLTTDHVGEHDFEIGGTVYTPIPGSRVQFENPDLSLADLIAFKLSENPPLPDLTLIDTPVSVGQTLTLVGNGRDRGAATTWMARDGWLWESTQSRRWGTNQISGTGFFVLGTRAFRILFDDLAMPGPDEHEADIIEGDSGGAAFLGEGLSTQLAGILYARTTSPSQPASTSLYGNGGVIVDLLPYRDAILAVIDAPACSDGFDTDQDGLTDMDDPGCLDEDDDSERGPDFECDNGIDDDGDLLVDFPEDDGCLDPTGLMEAPEPNATLLLLSGTLTLAGLGRRRAAGIIKNAD